jgi:hypothetical protein
MEEDWALLMSRLGTFDVLFSEKLERVGIAK